MNEIYVIDVPGGDPLAADGQSEIRAALEDQYGGELVRWAARSSGAIDIIWQDSDGTEFSATAVKAPHYSAPRRPAAAPRMITDYSRP